MYPKNRNPNCNGFKTCLIILFVLFFWVYNVRADYHEDIRKKINLTPTIEFQQIYDSNVLKLKDKEEVRNMFGGTKMDDIVYRYSTGIRIDLSGSSQIFSLRGGKEIVRHAYYGEQNYENDLLSGNARLNIGNKFHIIPAYLHTRRVISRRDTIDRSEQDFLNSNRTRTEGLYTTGQWELSGFKESIMHDYRFRTSINRRENIYGVDFHITPSLRKQFYIGFKHSKIKFAITEHRRDSTEEDFFLGAFISISGKSSLEFQTSQHKKIFSNSLSRDYSGIIGNVAILSELSSDTTLSLLLSRDTETSYYTDTSYDLVTHIRAEFSWELTPKTEALISINQTERENKGVSGRNPLIWMTYLEFGCGLTYQAHKNIELDLSSEIQKRNSNLEEWKFEAIKIVFELSFNWSLTRS